MLIFFGKPGLLLAFGCFDTLWLFDGKSDLTKVMKVFFLVVSVTYLNLVNTEPST